MTSADLLAALFLWQVTSSGFVTLLIGFDGDPG